MERLCRKMEDKLCSLLSFLTQLPGKLEMIADEIDNENLKNALCAVAAESNEYAKELNSQLRRLEIIPPVPAIHNLEAEIIEQSLTGLCKEKGQEILSICENCEAFFSRLYTDLLDDYLSNTSLRSMMNYQLLGIRSAFMRIRFLNSLRFSN
ncbi:MAG: hypothetical protein ABIQ31_03270 [Ferruginibacter sp.]